MNNKEILSEDMLVQINSDMRECELGINVQLEKLLLKYPHVKLEVSNFYTDEISRSRHPSTIIKMIIS